MDDGGAEDGPVEGAGAHDPLALELGALVRALSVGVGAEGRHLDESRHAGVACGVDGAACGFDVHPFEGEAADLASDADEVDDRVGALGKTGHHGAIEDAALHDRNPRNRECVGLRGGMHQRADGVPPTGEFGDEVTPDEAGRTGDGDGPAGGCVGITAHVGGFSHVNRWGV
jgi:hypothetical protein